MKILLFLFSLPYCIGTSFKNTLYRWKFLKPKKAPLPVISIGNIAFGGSEKTPLIINLLSSLLKEGYKPALVSRGYRGKWERRGGILSDGKKISGSWREAGDEPFMVANKIPHAGVFTGKNRLLSCQRAKDTGFEIVLLDDGFQHRRLARDLDIVLHDPSIAVSLREFPASLRRAHIILAKERFTVGKEKPRKPLILLPSVFVYSVVNDSFQSIDREKTYPPSAFRGKSVIAFCGIARPERFFTLLRNAGITTAHSLTFPDHHPYPPSSLQKIARYFKRLKPDYAITTEKDALKISWQDPILKDIPLFYAKIELKIQDEFYEKIGNFLKWNFLNRENVYSGKKHLSPNITVEN